MACQTKSSRDKGFSLIELLIVVAIILIVAAIAVPSLLSSKMAANESATIGSMRTMTTAFENYAVTYSVGYPSTLANLGASGSPSSTAADLLDAVLVGGSKSGYNFTYSPSAPSANGQINSYTLTATPIQAGVTGRRTFYTDQSLVIRFAATGTADSSSSPIS